MLQLCSLLASSPSSLQVGLDMVFDNHSELVNVFLVFFGNMRVTHGQPKTKRSRWSLDMASMLYAAKVRSWHRKLMLTKHFTALLGCGPHYANTQRAWVGADAVASAVRSLWSSV
jgi:hypothetical protein